MFLFVRPECSCLLGLNVMFLFVRPQCSCLFGLIYCLLGPNVLVC